MRSVIFSCVVAILCATVSVDAQTSHTARMRYMQIPPKIDGILNEGEWEHAEVLEFRDLNGGNKYKNQTIGHIGYNSNWLFLAFECLDLEMESIIQNKDLREDNIWEDDSIEILIAPNKNASVYYRFVVNAKGVQYDAQNKDSKWDYYWVAQPTKRPKMWQIEIAIPLSAFGIQYSLDKDKPDSFSANFIRYYRPNTKNAETTSWNPCMGELYSIETFGTLSNIVATVKPTNIDNSIDVELPKKWLQTNNKITVELQNPTDNDVEVILQIIDVYNFDLIRQTFPVIVPANDKLSQVLAITERAKDNALLQVLAVSGYNQKHVLASSSLFKIKYQLINEEE